MNTIEVDFEVLKALFIKRSTESVTYNDVLRQLLGLKPAVQAPADSPISASNSSDWISKGVRFPYGTEFRANYKGQTYLGKVEGGALFVRGRSFRSPSEAAVFITNNSVNGWIFWEARRPGEENWRILKSFRSKDLLQHQKQFSSTITDKCPEFIAKKTVTENDLRAKILRIPDEIKSVIKQDRQIIIYDNENISREVTIDKQGRYIAGGVTKMFKDSGLIGNDGTFHPKIVLWYKYRNGWKVEFRSL